MRYFPGGIAFSKEGAPDYMSFQPVTTNGINRAIGVVGLAVGLAIVFGGGYWIHRIHLDEFLFKRAVAEGQVIENRQERWYSRDSSGSSSSYISYRAIVRFADGWGQMVTHADMIAFSPPSFGVGQRVTVFYDPREPQHAMIDRGPKNFLVPGVCLVFAGLVILGSLQRLWRAKRDSSLRSE